MKNYLALVLGFCIFTACQQIKNKMEDKQLVAVDTGQFTQLFDVNKERSLTHRRFKHVEVDSLIRQKQANGVLGVSEIGKSFEGKSIYELTYGEGAKVVMLWSQMHGNEPTATMALFDLFNFLENNDEGSEPIRTLLKDRLKLHFIPMLNPDGADKFVRRNAQSIDLNRDARANHTVEGKLLKQRAMALKPEYGFNLHDQNIYYNVPGTTNPVAISLLAPAYNESREINSTREGAMQIIVGMNELLQQYIPDAVAKYDDTHTARGFGDNFQGWGASTILIESGAIKGDPEKQQIRKLNFIIILNALIQIAEDSYKNYNAEEYDKIPFNSSQLHDVVIRNLTIEREGVKYTTDIAVRRSEVTVDRDYYVRGRVEDLGDLQDEYGYDEIDATGLSYYQGKVYSRKISGLADLDEKAVLSLLQQGYYAVPIVEVGEDKSDKLHQLPINLFTQTKLYSNPYPVLGGNANFFLREGEELKYAVINGYLVDLGKPLKVGYKNRIQ